MPTRLVFVIIAAIGLTSTLACNRDPVQQSKPPVAPELMEQILFDLQVADVYSTMLQPDSLPQVNVKNKDSLAVYYRDILSHYNMTEEELATAMQWYSEHPAELETIYGNLQARFTELGSQYKE